MDFVSTVYGDDEGNVADAAEVETKVDVSCDYSAIVVMPSVSETITPTPMVASTVVKDLYDLNKTAKTASCRLCKKTYNTSKSSSYNLHRHLRTDHPAVYVEYKVKHRSSAFQQQPTVSQHFQSQAKYKASHVQQKKLREDIVRMVCVDMVPLRTVEGAGFRYMINRIDPKLSIPTRETVMRDIRSDHEKITRKLKQELKRIPKGNLHLLVDIWSSPRINYGILEIRGVWLTDAWKLRKSTLALVHMEGEHTRENILDVLQNTFLSVYELPLEEVVGYILMDNAKNMIKDCDILEETSYNETRVYNNEDDSDTEIRDILNLISENSGEDEFSAADTTQEEIERLLPCMAHTLQLVVTDGLTKCGDANTVIKHISAIFRFFKHSTTYSDKLYAETGLSLRQSSTTLWNSQLLIITRFSDENVFQAINNLLVEARGVDEHRWESIPTPFSTSHLAILTELSEMLKPFEEGTNALQGDSVTVSWILPTIIGIHKAVSRVQASEEFKILKKELLSSLSRRMAPILKVQDLWFASLLDVSINTQTFPAYGNAKRMSEPTKDEAIRALRSAAGMSFNTRTAPEERQRKSSEQNSSIYSFMTENCADEPHDDNDEIELYCSLVDSGTLNYNPVAFWKKYATKFPRLSALAMRILSVPASTGSVERLFRTAGYLTHARRSGLSVENLQSIVMCRERYNESSN